MSINNLDNITPGSIDLGILLRDVERLKTLNVTEELITRVLSIALAHDRSPTDVITDVNENTQICKSEGFNIQPPGPIERVDFRIAISVTGIMYATHGNYSGIQDICRRVKDLASRGNVPEYLAADLIYLAHRERPRSGL